MSYQQFHADVARFQASEQSVDEVNYFWWPDETDDQFRELLKEKKKNEGSQIRTYVGLREGEGGLLTLWMCLFGSDGSYITGFDNSWPCPPLC